MNPLRAMVLVLAGMVCWLPAVSAAGDEGMQLTPASPQPQAGALKSGLAVKYAFPGDVQDLYDADGWRSYGPKAGPPLVGFDYPNTKAGEKVLTTGSSEYVVAFIDGYMRFDAAGTYQLQFWSNDGLRVEIGGAKVYEHDGRHPCVSLGPQAVEVPSAGWYAVKALYFQLKNTACLQMKMQAPGGNLAAPAHDIYAHATN